MIYAGIGSRETPAEVLNAMRRVGARLAAGGWILRSGAAAGADTAFEVGCDSEDGFKEIYLPWPGFENHPGPFHPLTQAAFELAATYHPKWESCGPLARCMHARNGYQVLGADLETPADCVICWTADGHASGGTGQALRIARARGIPAFNLFWSEALDEFWLWVNLGCPACDISQTT